VPFIYISLAYYYAGHYYYAANYTYHHARSTSERAESSRIRQSNMPRHFVSSYIEFQMMRHLSHIPASRQPGHGPKLIYHDIARDDKDTALPDQNFTLHYALR